MGGGIEATCVVIEPELGGDFLAEGVLLFDGDRTMEEVDLWCGAVLGKVFDECDGY